MPDTQADPSGSRPPGPLSTWIVGALVLLGLVAALVTYKTSGSLATIAKVQGSHTLQPRAEAISTGEVAAAADSPQQDPGADGPGLTPGR